MTALAHTLGSKMERTRYANGLPVSLGVRLKPNRCELSLACLHGRALRNREKGCEVPTNASVRGYAAKGSQVPFFWCLDYNAR